MAIKVSPTEEVPTAKAVELLGVGRKTVIAYIEAGQLSARDVRVEGSSRPRWRIPLCEVMAMRNSHGIQSTKPSSTKPKKRTGGRKLRHIRRAAC